MARSRSPINVWVGIASAVVAAACLSGIARAGDECWVLSASEAKASLASPWYEQYAMAQHALKKNDVDAAIQHLRFAIGRDGVSSQQKRFKDGVTSYYPYLWLAKAFSLKEDFACAWKAIDREGKEGKIPRGSSEEKTFDDLKINLEVLKDKPELLRLAQDYERLSTSKDLANHLGDPGKFAAVKAAGDSLQKASTERLGQLSEALIETMVSASRNGAVETGKRIKRVTQEFRGANFGEDAVPSICAVSEDKTLVNAKRSLDDLKSCTDAELRVVRTAGIWACNELTKARGLVEATEAVLRAVNEAPGGTTSAVPADCQSTWSSGYLEASAALDRVQAKFTQLLNEYKTRSSDLASKMLQKEKEIRGRFESEGKRISLIAGPCKSMLGEAMQSRLEDLGKRLNPNLVSAGHVSGEIIAVLSEVDPALKDVVPEVLRRAQDLLGEARECFHDDVPSEFDSLSASVKAHQSNGSLDPVCQVASVLSEKLDKCWPNATQALSAKLKVLRWRLNEANAWLKRAGSGSDAAVSACLPAQGNDVANALPEHPTPQWTKRALAVIKGAQDCLVEHRKVRDQWSMRVVRGFTQLRTATEAIHGLPELSAESDLAKDVSALHDDVKQFEGELDEVAPLILSLEPKPKVEDLRNAPEANRVDQAVWAELSTLASGKDEPAYLEAWKSVRDAATLNVLIAAERVLEQHGVLAQALVPFATLHQVFTHLEGGKLDEAILTLRGQGSRPQDGERATALRQATLAYMLFIKSKLAGDGTKAATMLREDARTQVLAARKSDGAFELPRGLFGDSFRSFYEVSR